MTDEKELWSDEINAFVDAAFETVSRNPSDHEEIVAYRRAIAAAIEQHEAFRQEVSRVMTYIKALYPTLPTDYDRFIIPAPKSDPLIEVAEGLGYFNTAAQRWARDVRAALGARGLDVRIRSRNDASDCL
jgi:hypothetical protein